MADRTRTSWKNHGDARLLVPLVNNNSQESYWGRNISKRLDDDHQLNWQTIDKLKFDQTEEAEARVSLARYRMARHITKPNLSMHTATA